MNRLIALIATLGLLAALFPSAVSAAGPRSPMIVVFADTVADASSATGRLARAHGFSPRFVYQHSIKGFAADLSPAAVGALARNPNVAWVEADGMAYPVGDTTQTNATWGLDRIDQRALPLNSTYVYNQTGSGVTAYVIDSGIRASHTEFGGRARLGRDFVGTNNGDDCNGHGTHVAGTIGGATYGVAKQVSLVSVRVFDCTGGAAWSTVIAAVDWVTDEHKKGNGPSVANMSLSGGGNSSMDAAVRRSINAGVSYAVAAGNGNFIGREDDACKYSPARVTEAMTISATDKTDTKASWANYGNCVDWFAPGVGITSAWIDSDSHTRTISGTSMAAPHAAGVAALYLQANAGATPQQVSDALLAASTKGVVKSSRTATNHLLFSRELGGSSATAPSASFTATPTSGAAPLSVQFTDTSSGSPTSWQWDFGDGRESTDRHPVNEYTAAGTYTVTLTVSNSAGSNTTTGSITVTQPSGGTQPSGTTTTIASSTDKSGSQWSAHFRISVTEPGGGAASNADVAWTWSSGAGSSQVSCKTGADGSCPVVTATQHNRVSSVTLTITSVTYPNSVWSGSQAQETVVKP